MANKTFFDDADVPVAMRTKRDEMGSNVSKPDPRIKYPYDKYRIQLADSDKISPGGHYVGLNGKNWIIQPSVDVVVPNGVLYILDDAVELVPITRNTLIVDWVKRPRIPYINLGPVIDSESSRAA